MLGRWDTSVLQARTWWFTDLPKVLCLVQGGLNLKSRSLDASHGTHRCFHFSMLPLWIGPAGLSGLLLGPWLGNVTFAFENLNLETNLRKYSALTIVFIYRTLYLVVIFLSNVFKGIKYYKKKKRGWRPLNSRGRNGGFHCQIFSAPLHGHMESCVTFLL